MSLGQNDEIQDAILFLFEQLLPQSSLHLLLKRSDQKYKVPTHKHKCKNKVCGFVWEHEEPTLFVSPQEYEKRHDCPQCGVNTTFRYDPARGWYGESEAGEMLTSPG